MKPKRVLVILLLVGMVAAPILLLVGAAGRGQVVLRELVTDLVMSNIDGHPAIDESVERVPRDCLQCHQH